MHYFMPLTGVEGANAGGDGGSVDSSMSSGDEVLGANDSSPAPSPKRLLANVQGVNKVNTKIAHSFPQTKHALSLFLREHHFQPSGSCTETHFRQTL